MEGATLRLDPCVPRTWQDFKIVFRYRTSRYEVSVENHAGVCGGIARLDLDDQALPHGSTQITLVDDGATHHIRMTLG
jgi:cellobiose phosphorylase